MAVSAKTRYRVWERDGYRCVYCGDDDQTTLQVDHVQARSKGGGNGMDNLVTACRPCNYRKGGRLLVGYGRLPYVAPDIAPRRYLCGLCGSIVDLDGDRCRCPRPREDSDCECCQENDEGDSEFCAECGDYPEPERYTSDGRPLCAGCSRE